MDNWDEYLKEIDEHNKDWEQKWPNHCEQCGGWGGSIFQQGHPYGMGTAYETMFDPCDCVMQEDGKCPRCGEAGLTKDEGEGPCKFCGWDYDDGLREP